MMNMQRVRNGEMSERRLRYSPSLIRSIKESEAKNRNGLFETEDDGLGVRNNEDKKFKIMSDETARTLSRIREKAGGFLKKNRSLGAE